MKTAKYSDVPNETAISCMAAATNIANNAAANAESDHGRSLSK